MTLKITSNDGTSQVVEFTNLNPSIDFSIKNPIAVIALPTNSGSATAYSNFNTVTLNLKMLNVYVSVSFITKDGYGDNPWDLSSVDSSDTVYQQLTYLAAIDTYKKRLYLNSNSNYLYCHIMDYSAQSVAGQYNIIRHTLQLVVVGPSGM